MPWKFCFCSVIGVPMPYSRWLAWGPSRPLTRNRSARAVTSPRPFRTASTQTFCWLGTIRGFPPGAPGRVAARGMRTAKADANAAPRGPTKMVPFGRSQGWVGSLLITVMLPPACVGCRFSYRAVPPATRMFPSGSSMCPAQNRSHGVWMSRIRMVRGLSSRVLNVPALKNAWLFPEPAMISTSPLCSRVEWMPFTWNWGGMSSLVHSP